MLFIGISAGAGVGVWLLRQLAWRSRVRASAGAGGEAAQAEEPDNWEVSPDPDWLPHEREVYARVCHRIEASTREPLPWESLGEQAITVVDEIARELGNRRRGVLQFTLPEALLLLERSASRYRGYLLARLPFADRVSLGRLHWLWRQRSRATVLWKIAMGGRRVARFAINPTVGLLRELEQLIAGDHADYLSEQMQGVLQGVLLEEVAFAAVELYSGRLRFSDQELTRLRLAVEQADEARRAPPDQPLRLLFVGQLSAGKSTLINALLPEDRAETDVAATTADLVTYPAEIDGQAVHFIDSGGLDGRESTREALLEAMTEADLVVWTLRANRPAREADRRLKADFDAWFAARPQRRKPPLLLVATAIDLLAPGWPYPEHELPEQVQETINRALQAIARDLDTAPPRAVSALQPAWNLEALHHALAAELDEARLVQRNRRRITAGNEGQGLRRQAGRGAKGLWRGGKMVGGRLLRRLGGSGRTPRE